MVRIIFLLLGISFLLTSCMEGISTTINVWKITTNTGKYLTGITDDEKVKLTLQRKKELRNIRKGDYMTLKNNPEEAIKYYQTALEQLPNDIIIRRKIAHTYYLLRDFKNAYLNYSQVPIAEIKEDEQKELFQALFFDESRIDRMWELGRYDVDPMLVDYYRIADICYSGIHNCIVSIEGYTGQTSKVLSLQKSIQNATQISPDYHYRNFLVAAEFYGYSMYRVVDILTQEILSARPNYNEVKKLRWFALYELGRYAQSRDILINYIEQNPKDLESIVKLGDIYAALWDYTTSTLYFNNAVTAWYPNKAQVERRLAYNYSILNDNVSMMKVLSYLLQEAEVTEDDFAVAISLALHQWENTKAYAWAYTSIEKYKNSTLLIPLYLSALRINGKFHDTIEYVLSLDEENRLNPLVQLEYAIALYEAWKLKEALPIFDNIIEFGDDSDWAKEAQDYASLIEIQIAQSGSLGPKK